MLMQSVSALTLVSENIDRSRSAASIFDVAVATGDRSSHACPLPLPFSAYFSLSSSQFSRLLFVALCHCFSGSPYKQCVAVARKMEEGKRERERERERERQNDGETTAVKKWPREKWRGKEGWAKLTVTTSAWSLGKNFLSAGANQSDSKDPRT